MAATTVACNATAVSRSSVARAPRALSAAPLRASRSGRRALAVQAAVVNDFDTKVFPKELVK